jgi:mono/diheme cytochrome c family protein
MIPSAARERPNPVPSGAEAVEAGLEHFADHCAVCHANDGSGRVEIGENLYPRAPDMRNDETQSLTDGALFYIIEEGVRLTGMPGWKTGTPEGERESWRLVHFIRHLPRLTEEERRRMERLNPRTAGEWREEQEIEEFLAGDDRDPASRAEHERGHK